MKTVKIFYGGIPEKNTKQEKREVLTAFHQGVGQGGKSIGIEGRHWSSCDLAVMQGWVHEKSQSTPHLKFRKLIIDSQRKIGKHTLAIDSNLFLYRDPGNKNQYLRFSLDDIFPTTGNYFTKNIDSKRWQTIKKNIGFDLKSWRTNGNHVLICLQRNGGWSMGNLDVMEWCNSVIKKIQKHTDRPIVVRAHPGDKRARQYLKLNHKNVTISKNQNILDDFENCWVTVTYNSSPGVASAIEGIPVFVTDPEPIKSQAYDVCNTQLKNIENPTMPERQQWIEKISMCHFNFDELRQGIAWNIIKEHL